MNTSTIQLSSSPQVSWSTVKAQEKDAEYLSLRLLNKRARIRLSKQPLDLDAHDGKGNYFVVSNLKGWFVAIGRSPEAGYQIVFSPLSDLRGSIISSKSEDDESFTAKRVLQVAGVPVHLALALNDERLVVGSADGSVFVFDTSPLFTPGADAVEPLRTFPPAPPGPIQQILGNPGDLPELVAVRRDPKSGSDGLVVEIIDTRQLQSISGWACNTIESIPTSVVWSAKGKQLAIGLRNGDIMTYSPSDTKTPKLHVPKPPCVGERSIITVLWLTNQAFYGIYTPPGDFSPEVSQKHVLTLFDPKANSATQIALEKPYYPSPALRPPGSFTVAMRNWNPTKILVFVADTTSSDIGLIGSVSEDNTMETWCNLTLEETSTPSVPYDKDGEDTVPLALDMDLTAGQDTSAFPILYVYASDGTLQAWFVSNDKGGTYPGMITPSVASTSSTQSTDSSSTTSSAFAQLSGMSTFGTTGFGQPQGGGFASSVTDSPSKPAFGQSNTPGFGSSAFAQQPTVPAFGQTSAFGQSSVGSPFGSSAQSAFGQGLGSGFGAFASSGSSKFGSTGFGFGTSSPAAGQPSTPTKPPPAVDVSSPEADMAEADDGDTDRLGGLSLGGASDTNKSQDGAVNSMFGAFVQTSTPEKPETSPFGGETSGSNAFGAFGSTQGSGFLRPASGFGAFLKPTEPQSVPNNTSSDKETKTSPAFGTSGFGTAKPQSAFGQTGFGQPSPFGASSAFGKSSAFGSPAPPSTSATGTGGGFGAFAGASKGFSSFAQDGTTGFSQQAQTLQTKPSEAPSIAMATSSEDPGNPPSSSNFEQKSPSPFGTPQASSSGFPSAFGINQQSSAKAQEQKSSVFGIPTARSRSQSSSPEGSPNLGQKPKPKALQDESSIDIAEQPSSSPAPSAQSTTPFGTPTSSAFKASGAAPAGGAFGGLTSTPSVFKPSEGFGAFGASASVSSTSPFANPRSTGVSAFSTPAKPVSAFAVGGSGPASAFQTPTTGSTTPKFGSPSTPGATSVFGKSSFGSPSTPGPLSTTPLTTPAGNAFSGYSGSGGFSAFAKAGKPSSFSDLLKGQKDEDTSPAASETPAAGKDKKGDESFITISKPDELDQDNLPPTPSTHGTFDEEDQNLGDEQEHDDADSFISESFSGEEEAPEEEEEEEDSAEEEEGQEEEGEEEELVERTPSHARTQSPSAIPLPPTPDSRDLTPESAPALEKKESMSSTDSSEKSGKPSTAASAKGKSPSPIITQLPDDSAAKKSAPLKSPPPFFAKAGASGIPTLFGKPLAPTDKVPVGTSKSASPSPPPSLFGQKTEPSGAEATKPSVQSVFSKPVSSVREGSTTPPGSPSRPDDITLLPAPKPTGPSPAILIGLGRPSSRPTRSSPLAGTPVSGEEDKESPNIPSSQSAPVFRKPRPASPKVPFGQTAPTTAAQQTPVLPPFARPDEKQGQSSPLLPAGLPPKPFTPPPSQGPSATLPTTPAAPQNLFPTSGNAPFIMPSTAPTSLTDRTLPGAGILNANDVKPQGALFQAGAQRVATQTSFESSMQRECQALYVSMAEEFEQMSTMSRAAITMRTLYGRSTAAAHSREDLKERTKWLFGDLETFGRLVKGLEKDVLAVYKLKDEFIPLMREIESNLLKAETRKEEIVRFSKAKADPEFAKMLKARTLGPDASETQLHLRRQIRVINDRVEQLEAHLKSCKKKLEEHRKGKSSIKPPSLDTVNRIYRNIEVAIESQADQIETLTSRVAKLDLDVLDTTLHGRFSSPRRKSTRKGVFSVSGAAPEDDEKPISVRSHITPSIAASTAAALNAERSALRLKNALTNARRAPLLNTQAANSSKRILNLDNLSVGEGSDVPASVADVKSELPVDLDASLDDLRDRDEGTSGDNSRRTQRHSAHHQKSVRLGKTQTQVPASITAFDWGPLPKAKPMATLPVDIRPQAINRKASS
ncbi:uncharacterized protein FOMMEDRAFT_17163 [Fomitiporia mediterranea MF3/22]|uniref:uncharacterized protein n=1 Tax=Fomitiporia mediterranea (strain MF3/22) TaxID=694068 RepID=UPI0004407A1B|nr:uncharacterized protein FOMMEDRAFT_17163 [Fomitiporia mediterranea MF3/22]EJD06661.1 hypothetical protein FOMMEDRAFT_17163 [Fomitiporia mediterranea MF3/22]